jgi:hypothetical protein
VRELRAWRVDYTTDLKGRAVRIVFCKIDKLTYKLGPPQLTEADREIMHAHIIKAKD